MFFGEGKKKKENKQCPNIGEISRKRKTKPRP